MAVGNNDSDCRVIRCGDRHGASFIGLACPRTHMVALPRFFSPRRIHGLDLYASRSPLSSGDAPTAIYLGSNRTCCSSGHHGISTLSEDDGLASLAVLCLAVLPLSEAKPGHGSSRCVIARPDTAEPRGALCSRSCGNRGHCPTRFTSWVAANRGPLSNRLAVRHRFSSVRCGGLGGFGRSRAATDARSPERLHHDLPTVVGVFAANLHFPLAIRGSGRHDDCTRFHVSPLDGN